MKVKPYFFTMLSVSLILVLLSATRALTQSRSLKMAVGLSLAPYVISETNSGISLEIVMGALKLKGYTLAPIYVPFGERVKAYEEQKLDSIMTIDERSGVQAFYSDVVTTYQNVAICLKSKHLPIARMSDLRGKHLIAFQDATIYLGEEFAAAAKAGQYEEVATQADQVLALYAGKADVIVMDKNIFLYYRAQVAKQIDVTQPIVMHGLFPKNEYKAAFTSKDVRDDFNEGLKRLRESGEYKRIMKRYIKA